MIMCVCVISDKSSLVFFFNEFSFCEVDRVFLVPDLHLLTLIMSLWYVLVVAFFSE